MVILDSSFGPSAALHPVLRCTLVVILVAQVVLDTFSATQLHQRLSCLSAQTCKHVAGYSDSGMILLWVRDLGALILEVWALIVLSEICFGQGLFGNRFSEKQLFEAHDPAAELNSNFQRYNLISAKQSRQRAAYGL